MDIRSRIASNREDLTDQEKIQASRLFEQKYCNGCGNIIHRQARACPSCGAPQFSSKLSTGSISDTLSSVTNVFNEQQKNRTLAIILALLLGGIGIHKFYLGRNGWGAIYLLFCLSGIPAIIGLIEAIIYITMGEDAFHQKYG